MDATMLDGMDLDELLWTEADDLDELFDLSQGGLISPDTTSTETAIYECDPAPNYDHPVNQDWSAGGPFPLASASAPSHAFLEASAPAAQGNFEWRVAHDAPDEAVAHTSADMSHDGPTTSPTSTINGSGNNFSSDGNLMTSIPAYQTLPFPPNSPKFTISTAPTAHQSPPTTLPAHPAPPNKQHQASPKVIHRRERKRLQAQRYRAAHADEVEKGERRVAELRRQLSELEQEHLDLQLRSTVLANCLQRFQAMYNKLAAWQDATKQPIIMSSGLPTNPVQMKRPPFMLTTSSLSTSYPASSSDASASSPIMSTSSSQCNPLDLATSSMDSTEHEDHSVHDPLDPVDACITDRLEAFRHKTPAILAKEWSQFVFYAAAALGRLDSGISSAEEDVLKVFDDSAQYCLDCGAVNMSLLSYCWSINLERVKVQVPPLGHWRKVVDGLKLSEEQLRQAVLAYGWISTQFQGIPNQANDLCHTLDCLPMGYEGGYQPEPSSTSSGRRRQPRKTIPHSDELYAQLKLVTEKYKMCINLCKLAVFQRILSRVEGIRVLVYSYPFMPDAAALLIALAEKGRLSRK